MYLWALTPFIKFFRGDDSKKIDEEHKKTFGQGTATQDNEKNPMLSSPLLKDLNL